MSEKKLYFRLADCGRPDIHLYRREKALDPMRLVMIRGTFRKGNAGW